VRTAESGSKSYNNDKKKHDNRKTVTIVVPCKPLSLSVIAGGSGEAEAGSVHTSRGSAPAAELAALYVIRAIRVDAQYGGTQSIEETVVSMNNFHEGRDSPRKFRKM
jgi:hypothetical protein